MTKISPNVIIYITVLFVFSCPLFFKDWRDIYVMHRTSRIVSDLFKKRNVSRVSIRSLRTLRREKGNREICVEIDSTNCFERRIRHNSTNYYFYDLCKNFLAQLRLSIPDRIKKIEISSKTSYVPRIFGIPFACRLSFRFESHHPIPVPPSPPPRTIFGLRVRDPFKQPK